MTRGRSPLVPIARSLAKTVDALSFAPPVHTVYDPLVYAREPAERYFDRWGRGPKQVLWLGMNPGPFGMAQTGVPFGDVAMVRDFVGVTGTVGKPPREHPKRPIEGFATTRSEVSGTRLWGFARGRWGSAEVFFADHFVWNYCPLVFMDEGGANLTPDKLPKAESTPLLAACDAALAAVVDALRPALVVGVGAWPTKRAAAVLAGSAVRCGPILHPSPASPKANRGWAEAAARELEALGVVVPPA